MEVSADLVSRVTDAVHGEIKEWQSRPLEEVYAIVYMDAVRVKMRDEGVVRNKAVYLAIGVTCAGRKEVLGMWIERDGGGEVLAGRPERDQVSGDKGYSDRGRGRTDRVPGGH